MERRCTDKIVDMTKGIAEAQASVSAAMHDCNVHLEKERCKDIAPLLKDLAKLVEDWKKEAYEACK